MVEEKIAGYDIECDGVTVRVNIVRDPHAGYPWPVWPQIAVCRIPAT